MIRIHFAYRHVDRPWGGANNFIRALHDYLRDSGNFEFTAALTAPCDMLFMNELGTGPGGGSHRWPLRRIKALLRERGPLGRPALVVRAVNLSRHAFPAGPRNLTIGRWHDSRTIGLLNLADTVIFQSQYQHQFFVAAGYVGSRYHVIHNGADRRFWREPVPPLPLNRVLRLVSVTTSPRQTKRHDLIARLSREADVQVRHVGAWPEGLDRGRVELLGTLTSERIADLYADSHYLLHPAVKDPCPNSVFEGICAGIPVIFNSGPGSSREIVGECGLALDEEDLAGTAVRARHSLQSLRAMVLQQRARYRIEHAAAAYSAVFQQLRSQ